MLERRISFDQPAGACSVRRARLADLDRIVELENLSFEFDLFTRAHYRYLMVKANSVALVLERNGRLIGSAVLLFRRNAGNAHLYTIAIRPEMRGRGYGARLLKICEGIARRRGCNRLTLEVRADNRAAKKMYKKAGYTILERVEAYYEDGCDALRLMRMI